MKRVFLRNISAQRGDHVVLRGIDIELRPGEGLHLHGSNGSGKTTLLEIIAGLRLPLDGAIEERPEPEELHWIGHKNGLHTALNVEENLQFWCALQNVPRDRLGLALDRLGLWQLRRRACRALSVGQKRRVALARLVLAPRPLWLLDEPFAGLDAEGGELLAGMIEEHRGQNGMVLLTSHQALPQRIAGFRRQELR